MRFNLRPEPGASVSSIPAASLGTAAPLPLIQMGFWSFTQKRTEKRMRNPHLMRGHRFLFPSGRGVKPKGTLVGRCAGKVCAGGKVLLIEGQTPVGQGSSALLLETPQQ